MLIAALFYRLYITVYYKSYIFWVSRCRISLSVEDGKLTWQNLTLYRCSLISGSASNSKKISIQAPEFRANSHVCQWPEFNTATLCKGDTWTSSSPLFSSEDELSHPGASAPLKTSAEGWHTTRLSLHPYCDEWQEIRWWPWQADYEIPLSTWLSPVSAS